jgi:hypothetical protein
MSPRTLLSGTAVTLAGFGLAFLFFPSELGVRVGFAATAAVPLQLFSSGLLAMATLNWMGRGAIYGGIYGRPIVVSNFGFGVITAGTLTSALLDGSLSPWAWVLAVIAASYAMAFWRVLRRPPWSDDARGDARDDSD